MGDGCGLDAAAGGAAGHPAGDDAMQGAASCGGGGGGGSVGFVIVETPGQLQTGGVMISPMPAINQL